MPGANSNFPEKQTKQMEAYHTNHQQHILGNHRHKYTLNILYTWRLVSTPENLTKTHSSEKTRLSTG